MVRSMRDSLTRPIALIAAVSLALLLASCGGEDTEDEIADTGTTAAAEESESTQSASTEPEDNAEESESTDPPSTESEDAAAADDTAAPVDDTAGAGGSTVSVELDEWVVDTETTLSAGTITFEVANVGSFPHEFGITRGDSYDDLPQLANGAIDEDTLGADVLGKTGRISPGESATIDFDLEAGNYVFFCNIAVGPNSHAASGQVLSVTVE